MKLSPGGYVGQISTVCTYAEWHLFFRAFGNMLNDDLSRQKFIYPINTYFYVIINIAHNHQR